MVKGEAVKHKKLKVQNYYKFCRNCDRYIFEDQEYILVKAQRNNDGEYFHKDYTGCVESSEPERDVLLRFESRRWTLH